MRRQVTVESVVDSDTFETTTGELIRILNWNAPEKGFPGYQDATRQLKSKIENQVVTINEEQRDAYGRTLAIVVEPWLNQPVAQYVD